jgi:DUF438 domain-containing protein
LVKRRSSSLPKVHPTKALVMENGHMQTEEEMLKAEIEFWRHMIKSRKGTVTEQATERMRNACELAERKLMLMDSYDLYVESRQSTGVERWNN